MGFSTRWNFSCLYSFLLIVIVSSRHLKDSGFETQPDPSKSGKPGEYLWYKTSSENGVAKSFIPTTSHPLEHSEDSGEIPSQQEENLSGSGEHNDESSSEDFEKLEMSGSGSYAASYMVDISEGANAKHNEETEYNERDSSGSANMEEGSSLGRDSEQAKVKIDAPAVVKPLNPKRRSDIFRMNKMEKESDDTEYDKLFKDFGTEGDLDPAGLEDEDSNLDDSLSEEEAQLLMPEEDEDDKGNSKSKIGRPDKEQGNLTYTFKDMFDDGKTRLSDGKLKKAKSHSSVTKEILAKLDIDVFRGNHSEEHTADHMKKQRHHKRYRNHFHHEHIAEQSKEADSSKALSHHAESGIFNGSVSNVTLEAEKQKKHPKHHHKRHHHHHAYHHRHHDYHHHRHHHQHRHAHKDVLNDVQIHLQQENSNAQYSPQLQPPSEYNPYPSPYPAQQSQMSPYQPYQIPTSDYEYHSLQNADRQGAVCLDGSTPGYFLRKGSGGGSKKWIIYLQGGAWCDSEKSCLGRSRMNLGSSFFFDPVLNPGGLLSSKKDDNQKFYNWNVAYLPYCDGSSFSGNRSDPVEVGGSLLYFRGFRILDATITELLSSTSLAESTQVVFSGTSAGGLAVMLHADFVRSKLPKKVHFRALADSGFFLDSSSRKNKGHPKFRKEMQNMFKLHDCTDGVPQKCADEMPGKDLWKCIFPQYFLKFVKSKMFIVNPLYDSWQLQHIWEIDCASTPYSCTKKEVKQIKKFRRATLRAMAPVFEKPNLGLFADSCVDHGQVVFSNRWNSIAVRKTDTISSSFIKWLKSPSKRKYFIDKDKYPANPTCVTVGVAKRSDILTEGF